jgi:hypothetical protein
MARSIATITRSAEQVSGEGSKFMGSKIRTVLKLQRLDLLFRNSPALAKNISPAPKQKSLQSPAGF